MEYLKMDDLHLGEGWEAPPNRGPQNQGMEIQNDGS